MNDGGSSSSGGAGGGGDGIAWLILLSLLQFISNRLMHSVYVYAFIQELQNE